MGWGWAGWASSFLSSLDFWHLTPVRWQPRSEVQKSMVMWEASWGAGDQGSKGAREVGKGAGWWVGGWVGELIGCEGGSWVGWTRDGLILPSRSSGEEGLIGLLGFGLVRAGLMLPCRGLHIVDCLICFKIFKDCTIF